MITVNPQGRISYTGITMSAVGTKALLLFGGADHKTFIGCLNCGAYNDISVCSRFGKFGSKYEPDSIWNPYGTFGSKYNVFSPWNKYTNTAPIIVNEEGGSYGYFSVNRFHHDRTQIGSLLTILDFYLESGDLALTRERFCG